MSAGNLYRYFPSKEAIVQELCAREQAERARSFAAFAGADSVIAAMAQGLRKNLLEKPREKMQMILEIWAEAGRNPAIAALCDTIDANVHAGLTGPRRGRERQGRSGWRSRRRFRRARDDHRGGGAFQAPRP